MTRPVDLENRAALLERITGYVVEHGLAELSLRPLAQAVDSSPRMLLYHFGSKEGMVAAVLRAIRERQFAIFDRLRRSDVQTPAAICKAAWAYMSDPTIGPMLKLFFETYALALRKPDAFPGFFEGAVEDWLRFLADPICTGGASPQRARDVATIILATYRGFMLDYAATGDSKRIGRAIDLWSASLDAIKYDEDDVHAQHA
jgi:AcrR family transcriptional regulator